jgi:adenylate cyclase
MSKADHQRPGLGDVSVQRSIVRRLAAILGIDIRGYSALMDRNEENTHRRVGASIDRAVKEINRFRGRVFSFAGDGLMAEFPSSVAALRCALKIQAEAIRHNAKLLENERILYRIGINAGEIVVQGDRVGGTAVNIAARLEQYADPGSVWMSELVYDQVRRAVPADYAVVGVRHLKNIRQPVAVYRIAPSDPMPRVVGPVSEVVPERINVESYQDYRPSLAVLPFRSLHQEPVDAYFAEGMVDDIIRVLGGLKDLIVVSRSSTFGFTGTAPALGQIAQQLNVQYVLHGSVRRAGNQLRIAVELTDGITQRAIWADSFDGDVSEIFDLQDRIALHTASAIGPYVYELELRRGLQKDGDSITAYDLTLQALNQIYSQDRGALARAQTLLQKAIDLNSTYSAALSHLAYLHIFRIGQGWSINEHEDRLAAAEMARLAIERDRNDALGLAIHGHLHGYLHKDHESAVMILDRAIAANPSCALAWAFSSFTRGIMGDASTAVSCAQKAIRLSPIGPDLGCWYEHALSQAHYLAGNYSEAISWGRVAASHGKQTSNLRCLIASLVAAGEMEEARAVGLRLLEALPDFRLTAFRAYTPLKDQTADLFVDRLHRAGIPD